MRCWDCWKTFNCFSLVLLLLPWVRNEGFCSSIFLLALKPDLCCVLGYSMFYVYVYVAMFLTFNLKKLLKVFDRSFSELFTLSFMFLFSNLSPHHKYRSSVVCPTCFISRGTQDTNSKEHCMCIREKQNISSQSFFLQTFTVLHTFSILVEKKLTAGLSLAERFSLPMSV